MKTAAIILGVLGVIFLGSQIYFYISSNTIEEYPYTVIKEYDDFEIRQYEASLFTSVTLKMGEYNKASRKGFSILGGYIFGANEKKESISMTSPVSMSLEDEMTMMFMVPKEFSKETLPKPENQNIEFIQMPEKKMAAITFGGWANDKKIEQYKAKLISVLAENNIKHNNTFSVLGYNPPYEVLFRRNEIIVELK
jgi:hypothetical protein